MNIAADGLCVEKVHVWRGDRHVLKNVSLQVRAGELVHVSGPNGTGKTTLLRVVSGLLRPEQGTVAWRGKSIASSPTDYQSELAYASHEAALKGDLTAIENLRFMVGLKRRVTLSELQACLARVGVAECADLPARVLSAGQRRRVAMARVLAFRASLWLLDEPFTNLDASGSQLMSALLEEHIDKGGLAVVVAHHDLNLAVPTRHLGLGG
ncbi:MAG TPA: cytochrome c biogenesis heme-transporting ATPase CcmA [Steroidobacteraceae bacterium]|jgi:heme exporter protein A|nr:cytochrome c biogenesis heme-transporting ATPase CcmA [Steroidobacteraceae bacterium]